jgi:hypothetical protein
MNNEGASEQMLVDDESWLIYKYPSKLGDINAKLARQAAAEKARQAAAAEKARQAAVAEAQRRAEIMIPVLEVKAPIADVEWTTDQSTFDYIKTMPPCNPVYNPLGCRSTHVWVIRTNMHLGVRNYPSFTLPIIIIRVWASPISVLCR